MSVKHITSDAHFKEEIAAAGSKLVVVDFFATWCGPCKRIAPFVEELAGKNTDVVFLKVDVDEVAETAQAWSVSAMPTFLYIKNGAKVDELVGASNQKLVELITKNK